MPLIDDQIAELEELLSRIMRMRDYPGETLDEVLADLHGPYEQPEGRQQAVIAWEASGSDQARSGSG